MRSESEHKLHIRDEITDTILDCEAHQLHLHLPGPTLFRLQGRKDDVLFISVLLHGNEITGWDAVRQLLKKYNNDLPRSIYVFVGNISAARKGVRVLESQSDFNRIWNAGDNIPEGKIVEALFAAIEEVKLFAAIDVHNNTGLNPHYACVNKLATSFLHLATLFGRTVVYFLRPDSVMSMAFSKICPSVTIECGKPDDAAGAKHALEYLDACLHLSGFPQHEVAEHDIDLFHTVATVKVLPGIDFSVGKNTATLNFVDKLDRMNFQEFPAGQVLGYINRGGLTDQSLGLKALDEQGEDVTDKYFTSVDNQLCFNLPFMPSMLTLDEDVIRQDCLCYIMERLDYRKSNLEK